MQQADLTSCATDVVLTCKRQEYAFDPGCLIDQLTVRLLPQSCLRTIAHASTFTTVAHSMTTLMVMSPSMLVTFCS